MPCIFDQQNPPEPNARQLTDVRAADISFVIDQLGWLNQERNPDAEIRFLPAGFRGALQLNLIGIYGQVGGGVAGLQAMSDDRRVAAVAGLTDDIGTEAMDWAEVVHHGVDGPSC